MWNKDASFPVYYYAEGYDSNDNHKGFFDEALSRGWKIGPQAGAITMKQPGELLKTSVSQYSQEPNAGGFDRRIAGAKVLFDAR